MAGSPEPWTEADRTDSLAAGAAVLDQTWESLRSPKVCWSAPVVRCLDGEIRTGLENRLRALKVGMPPFEGGFGLPLGSFGPN